MTNDFNAQAQEALANAHKKENNSGGGTTIITPDKVKKHFNWGAFGFSWIWGICNKSYLTLIIFVTIITNFIPFLGSAICLGLSIWFGIKGNEWAWQNKEWNSVEHFHSVQKKWAIATIIMSIIYAILFIFYITVVASMIANPSNYSY